MESNVNVSNNETNVQTTDSVTLEDINTIVKREFKSKDEAVKYIKELHSYTGDQKIQKARKLSQLLEENNLEVDPDKFKEYVEHMDQIDRVREKDVWMTEAGIDTSLDPATAKEVFESMRHKTEVAPRRAPANNEAQAEILRREARRGNSDAQHKLVEESLGLAFNVQESERETAERFK